MVQVRVKFFGFHDLRRLIPDVQGSAVCLSLADGSTVRELLQRLAETYGEPIRQRLFTPAGDLRSGINVFLEGGPVENGLTTKLEGGPGSDTDVTLMLLNPVQGG